MDIHRPLIVCSLLTSLLYCGCKPSTPASPPPPPVIIQDQAPTSSVEAFMPSKKGTVIAGKVIYKGPKIPLTVNMAVNNPVGTNVLNEDILVNPDGTLSNVLVYVKKGLENQSFTIPTKPLYLDARSWRFDPHVLAIQTGQTLVLRNCDNAYHHVNFTSSIPSNYKAFNLIYMNSTNKIIFNKPQIGIPVRDYMYPMMTGFLHVISHPFFNVTNYGGVFRIEGLPPGTYTIEAWQEKLGTTQFEITLDNNKLIRLDIEFNK